MGKIVVTNHVTLDGTMQGPASPDEDPRERFERGGWAAPNNDDVMFGVMAKGMAAGGSLLLGRRTYEHFYGYWPHQTDNPYTDVLNNTQKYVVSTTLDDPLPWQNSTLISDDVAGSVAQLKEQSPKDFVILGSGELIRSLMKDDLIDRFLLMIHPVVLGTGRRLFPDAGPHAPLTLTDSVVTTTGVVIATYDRMP
jgi:dihydrofolate reductase